ncbi:hypothetical protein [Dehalobacter sp. TBBPA1]|uniref:hypothetical protein n=1 Tax=Dehalobacter sp. TBBPA1 TaxID=3235037 RepID=UPI0034A1AA78
MGAAIAAKHFIEEHGYANGSSSSFIGFDAVAGFDYTQKDSVSCSLCANHYSRTV